MNIYEILQSKPHNNHYLKRYWKFISSRINRSLEEGIKYDAHHICPKAADLFPEYEDFKINPWNKVYLTLKEHVLAHVMLWKAYGGSQTFVIYYMLNCYIENGRVKPKVPTSIQIRYAVKAKEDYRSSRKGMHAYKDAITGKMIGLLPTDHPDVLSGKYVGSNKGLIMSEDATEKMKGPRVLHLFYKGFPERKSLKLNDPNFDKKLSKHLSLGWELERSEESRQFLKEKQIAAAKVANTGTTTYYYPNSGILYGRIPHDSPIIKELGLVHIRSEKQKKQASEQALRLAADRDIQERKSKTMSNLSWYYNPNTGEKARLVSCPDGWLEGRGDVKPNEGKITYNDGVKNYMLKVGEVPEPHWVKGMAPQKQRVINYTNGVDWIQLRKGEPIPPGYKRSKRT